MTTSALHRRGCRASTTGADASGPDGLGKPTYALRHLRAALGTVHLVSVEEVACRVAEGGHDVPEADVRRRVERSDGNFALCATRAERWRLLDNGGVRPSAVAEGVNRRAEFVDEERPAALPAGLGVARPPCLM